MKWQVREGGKEREGMKDGGNERWREGRMDAGREGKEKAER